MKKKDKKEKKQSKAVSYFLDKDKNADFLAGKSMLKTEKNTEKILDELAVLYSIAKNNTIKELRSIYENYKEKENLNDKDAIEYLNNAEKTKALHEILNRIKETESEEEKKRLIAMYNAGARVYRMKREVHSLNTIRQHMLKLGADEEKLTKLHYTKVISNADGSISKFTLKDNMKKSIGTKSKDTINSMLKQKWYSENFESRIWKNKDKLMEVLETKIKANFLQGKNLDKSVAIIKKEFDVSTYIASRLVRTESSYFHNQIILNNMKKTGFKRYRYVATLDKRTSKICSNLHKKEFNISEAEIGINYPPMHPFCRSTVTPVIGEEEKRVEKEKYNMHFYIKEDDIKDITYKKNEPVEFTGEYLDITNMMLKTATPNSHDIKKLTTFILEDKIYDIDMYPPKKGLVFDHDKEEMKVAEIIKTTLGGEIFILPNMRNFQGIKMADYLWKDERWDVKTIQQNTDGKNTFLTQAEKMEGQAGNLILNIKNPKYKDGREILNRVTRIYGGKKYSYVNKILIVFDDKIQYFFRRI